jgi:hypothetical protein
MEFFMYLCGLIKYSICFKMKQAIRTSFLFLMLAIFLIGTTGVSFYIHECTSSQKKEVFAFPEILNQKVSCCCAEDVHGNAGSADPDLSYKDPGCCKNIHVYLKASFTGVPLFYQFNPDLTQKIIHSDFLTLLHNDTSVEITSFTSQVDHPPPRSGRSLVFFLQQIKIPAPVS